MKILIVRLSALGDIVGAFPTLGALRAQLPEAEIHWLVEDRGAALLAMMPGVAKVHVYERKALVDGLRARRGDGLRRAWALVRALRAERFDAALDLQGNLKSGVLTLLSGARRRIGFARDRSREGNWLFLNERVALDRRLRHRVESQAALLAALGLDPTPVRIGPAVSEDAVKTVAEGITKLGAATGPLVVMHPGTSAFGTFKRWPPERFADLGATLALRWAARVVVTWGPGEADLAREVIRRAGPGVRGFETRSLEELTALLARADLVIAGDTGPLHLASALGRKVVGLYGPKDPTVYGPYWPEAETVRAGVDCSPCSLRRCDDPQCMLQITSSQVVAAAERRLSHAP